MCEQQWLSLVYVVTGAVIGTGLSELFRRKSRNELLIWKWLDKRIDLLEEIANFEAICIESLTSNPNPNIGKEINKMRFKICYLYSGNKKIFIQFDEVANGIYKAMKTRDKKDKEKISQSIGSFLAQMYIQLTSEVPKELSIDRLFKETL